MIVDEYGTYIHKKSNRFIFVDKTEKLLKKGFSADKVSQILIYKGAAVTADAIELAVKKGIDIVYLDRLGKPFARTYSCEQENSATVQRYQARAYDDGKGIILMSSMIGAKIRNQAYFLKSLAKNRGDERLAGQAERIMSLSEKIKERAEEWGYIEEARESLFGIEGEASRIYFQALSNIQCEDEKLKPLISKNIANHLGVTLQTTTPILKSLEASGLLSSRKGSIKRGEPAGGKSSIKIWRLTDEGKIYAVYFSKEKF